MNSLGKNTKSDDLFKAVETLRQSGIESFGSFIIGNLNERAADVEKTIDLAIRLDTNIAQFSILTPYPGTRLFEQIRERIFTRRWKSYDGLHLVFRHPFINRFHLQFLLLTAFVRFYRRSREAIEGFKLSVETRRLSCRHILKCAWELLF